MTSNPAYRPLEAESIMSGTCTLGVVAICVSHPLWPFKVPLR